MLLMFIFGLQLVILILPVIFKWLYFIVNSTFNYVFKKLKELIIHLWINDIFHLPLLLVVLIIILVV